MSFPNVVLSEHGADTSMLSFRGTILIFLGEISLFRLSSKFGACSCLKSGDGAYVYGIRGNKIKLKGLLTYSFYFSSEFQ